MLTEAELEKVIMATVRGQSRTVATEAEIRQAVAWAHRARVDGALLSAVLDGAAVMQVDPARGVRFYRAEPTAFGDVDPQRRAA